MQRKQMIEFQEKVGTKYDGGLVFPGGHVETGESLKDSVIREMKEEKGLTIHNPQLCGFKDWIKRMEKGILFCCIKLIVLKEK